MRPANRPPHRRFARVGIAAVVALVGAGTSAALSGIGAGARVTATAERTLHQVEVAVERSVPPRRTYVVSDSVLAGIELNGHLDRLGGTTWVTDLEVCRRLVATSCQLAGSPRPPTVIDELRALTWQPDEFDLLVVATGYNDRSSRFAPDLASVVATARSAGFRHIAWLDYHADGGGWPFTDYAQMNTILAAEVAGGAYPDVTVWPFDAFTTGRRTWFGGDNIHLTGTGAAAIADWLSAQAAGYDVT